MDFQRSYNRQDFLRFLRNDFLKEQFLEQIEETDLAIKINSRFFSKITKLGTALDLDNLIVLEIEHKSKNDARISLTKDIFKLLRQYELEGIIRQHALIILTNPDLPDQYRLSLLTTTYNDKFEEKLSNPKRYSFLLGVGEKIKTAKESLIDFKFLKIEKKKDKLENIEDLVVCFNVESVRNAFFNDYLNLYVRLYKSIIEANDFHELLLKNNVDIVSFTKNLLGKIVFLYFIQKKGWFKNKETGIGDNLFFKNIWDDFNNKGEKNSIEKKNYFYNDYLEYIFYEGLNIENRDSDFSKKFGWEIPYLNGGLFKEDYPNWKENIAKISNNVFSNEKENGILDIFNIYNFTIDEDDLYDKEVAIDPEMLGKIFEKMISVDSRNIGKIVETYDIKSSKKRDTFITMDIENWNVGNNNKKLGAFYTPREIVHYMTKESLINYLINNLDGKKEDKEKKVRDLFDFKDKYLTDNDLSIEKIKNDFENIKSIIIEVDEKIKKVKILDPAIGSGAFPMGILHEISTLRYYIYDVLIKHILGEKSNISMYRIKKEIIENNIYGVDIEPGAIDIARLRFWLSLIVDEETPEPLPNFEFKFVCANTLLPIEKEEKQLDMEGYIKDEAKLETLKKYKGEYFNISDKEKKEALKNRIRNYTALNNQQELGYIPSKRAFQFNEFGSNFDNPKHSHSFFDPSLMMSEGRGFDIVIGNPPYIDSETMVKKEPELRIKYSKIYKYAKGNWDIFIPFVEKGFLLLNNNGIISFIVPNKLIGAKYSESIKEYILQNTIYEIRDYSKVNVFKEADVYPISFLFGKQKINKKSEIKMSVMKNESDLLYYNNISSDIFYNDIFWDRYFLENTDLLNLIMKISLIDKLHLYVNGIVSSATVSEAYLIKDKLIDGKYDNNINLKFINTGTIDPYVSYWGKKETTYIKGKYLNPLILIEDLKNINLTRFEQSIKPKLIIAGMATKLEVFLDYKGEYVPGKSTSIIIDNDINKLKYILSILNSKLLSFWYINFYRSLTMAGGYLNFNPNTIKQLPIKQISFEAQKPFINLVDKILKITNTPGYNPKDIQEEQKKLENEIDKMVYELYGLSEDEVRVVEESLEK